jgi:small subunit ribosomal protein S20
MANHSATKKAIRKTVAKTAINKNRKSRIKTFIKRVVTAVTAGSAEEANKALIDAQSEIMRGVAAKLIKKNTAARKVSRLSKSVKGISDGSVAQVAPEKAATKKSAAVAKKATTAKAPAEGKITATKAPEGKKPAVKKAEK